MLKGKLCSGIFKTKESQAWKFEVSLFLKSQHIACCPAGCHFAKDPVTKVSIFVHISNVNFVHVELSSLDIKNKIGKPDQHCHYFFFFFFFLGGGGGGG